ncbi:MAG TPA: hypothetical protein VFP72_04365 [Kineosporiaceae bacterium]|nr:hypothetical protein [Kineosporiaceae bacterium]
MGNRVFSLEMSARPGSGDPVPLQRELWRMLRATIGHWIKCDELADIGRYLDSLPGEPDWPNSPYELQFALPEDAMGADVAVGHWVELAVGAEWSRVCRRAEAHGFTMCSQRPPIWPADKFVTLRDKLWALGSGAEGPVLNRGLLRLTLADLSGAEQRIVGAALRECGCQPCKILRPDPPMAQTLVRLLGESAEARQTVQWYLSRARSLPPEMAEAVARVCEQDPAGCWGLVDAVQRVAGWGGTLRMQGNGLGATTVRLAWMSGGGRVPEGEQPGDIVPLLKEPSPLCGLAAEVASTQCHASPDAAAAELVGLLERERDPRARYHAVRCMSSLFLVARTMPEDVEEALRREASRPDDRSESVALARVLVNHLNGSDPAGW